MTPLLILTLLVAVVIALLAVWIWIYRRAAAVNRAEADRQAQRANQAETRVSRMQTRNASLQHLQQKQRAETIDATKPQHLAERNDLDNDWSDRLPGAATGASHSGAADTTRAPDSAGD